MREMDTWPEFDVNRIIEHLCSGLSVSKAAKREGVPYDAVRYKLKMERKKRGARSLVHLIAMSGGSRDVAVIRSERRPDELRIKVNPAIIKALRLIAEDSRDDTDSIPNKAVTDMMGPEIAAQLLEGAVIDAIRERYDKALGEL
jgi:hypothetical protein